ncbi:MAG: hypothetical protein Q8R35_03165 [bacterium]|nr:hypothetical protein [bacterium]
MNKKLLIAIIVIVLAAAALWWWQSNAPATPSAGETVGSDDTAAISQELETVDLGDVDKEFQAIDADLDSL